MKARILLILSLMVISVNLHAMDEYGIKNYMKTYIERKMNAPVKKIDVISNYTLKEAPGWEVYFLSMKVNIKFGESYRDAIVPQTVFTKGDKITFKLMKKGKNGRKDLNYAKLLKPKVPIDAYDAKHFLAGSRDAPHKIVVFSDPFCPYCREKIPEILDVVNANPKVYGLYYYHLPLLRIHPAADLTTKAMHIFQHKGDMKNMMALYDLFLEPSERNPKEIIKAIKAKTGVTFTLAQLESEQVKESIRVDIAMKRRLQVTGTPTIFIDGMWDRTRNAYKQYAKKK
ncbi:MAG: thioredoxin domain-containing protein [Epsilonproteobacteria bacterium]|nr:thioredoxin domain-containing protein [Campylobacterota bacterium]